ncbi:MAG: glucose-6-phosphate isomerase [Clostridia bacterium]|nr:glucose-6-phosphate isomerase [Clostridia bacterium]
MAEYALNSPAEELFFRAEAALGTLLDGSGEGAGYRGWLELPQRREWLPDIRRAASRICGQSDALVVIGVGGSYLGARAALDFIGRRTDAPEILFAGNGLSADALAQISDRLADRDFSLAVISKSGGTLEPAAAFRVLRVMLERKYGGAGAAERIFAVTDPAGGRLRRMAEERGYFTLPIPPDVGGRFSVLSPVGLLPMAAAGVDIEAVLDGAAAGMRRCTAASHENPALSYAAVRGGLYEAGKRTEILALFDSPLRFLGEWWKQLFAESEGKHGRGIFPACAEFTADLHSMGQYIQQGPRDIFETFLTVEHSGRDIVLPEDDDADGLGYLAGRSLDELRSIVMRAVRQAHLDGDVPVCEVRLERRDEAGFGELTAFFQVACGISAYMLGVNPFDQPGVEEYKKNMLRILAEE